MYDIVAQGLGIIGMLLTIGSLQCRRVRNFYIVQFAASFFFVVSYFMLGSVAGALFNLFGTVRGIILLGGDKTHRTPFLLFLLCCLAGIGVYNMTLGEGWLSLLPLVAQTCGTAGMWSRNGKTIRILQFCGVSPLWLIYNCIVGSVGGVGCEAFNMVSVVVSILRFGWKALGEDPKGEKGTGGRKEEAKTE